MRRRLMVAAAVGLVLVVSGTVWWIRHGAAQVTVDEWAIASRPSSAARCRCS